MENRIAELRKARRISQAELAEAVAVTRQTIISLESGRYNASLLLAHKIAKYFDTTIEDTSFLGPELFGADAFTSPGCPSSFLRPGQRCCLQAAQPRWRRL